MHAMGILSIRLTCLIGNPISKKENIILLSPKLKTHPKRIGKARLIIGSSKLTDATPKRIYSKITKVVAYSSCEK